MGKGRRRSGGTGKGRFRAASYRGGSGKAATRRPKFSGAFPDAWDGGKACTRAPAVRAEMDGPNSENPNLDHLPIERA
jgi:hypothetical protein